MKKLVIVFALLLLASSVYAFDVTYTCGTDSDGDDKFTYGYIDTTEGVDLYDFCTSSTVLVEYYCNGNTATTKSYTCTYGCLDGKCRSNSCAAGECNIITNMYCSSGTWTTVDYCSYCGAFDSDCTEECDEGQCDYQDGEHCLNGEWIEDYYCDQEICGAESDPNNLCAEVSASGTETECSDELDNDNDGSFDCFDSDCSCECDHGDPQDCGSDEGECQQGVQTCEFGIWGLCGGEVVADTEWCDDSLDNDCDGEIDEDDCWCTPGDVRACGSDQGVCGTGIQECSASGKWGVCYGSGYSAPTDEIFDGLDNDCDGEIDEDFVCQEGETQSCGSSEGWCEEGVQTCENGTWGNCIGGVEPLVEICNDYIDNDCDGLKDDDDDECVEGDAVANYTFDEEESEGCETDDDCNSEYTCLDGSCILHFDSSEDVEDDDTYVAPETSDDSDDGIDWLIIVIPLVIILVGAGLVVWYLFFRSKPKPKSGDVKASVTSIKSSSRITSPKVKYKPAKMGSKPSKEEEALGKSLEQSKKMLK